MRERCVLRFVVFSELSHLIHSVDSEVSSSLIALWSYFLLVWSKKPVKWVRQESLVLLLPSGLRLVKITICRTSRNYRVNLTLQSPISGTLLLLTKMCFSKQIRCQSWVTQLPVCRGVFWGKRFFIKKALRYNLLFVCYLCYNVAVQEKCPMVHLKVLITFGNSKKKLI